MKGDYGIEYVISLIREEFNNKDRVIKALMKRDDTCLKACYKIRGMVEQAWKTRDGRARENQKISPEDALTAIHELLKPITPSGAAWDTTWDY
jgi:hypothetical protein